MYIMMIFGGDQLSLAANSRVIGTDKFRLVAIPCMAASFNKDF